MGAGIAVEDSPASSVVCVSIRIRSIEQEIRLNSKTDFFFSLIHSVIHSFWSRPPGSVRFGSVRLGSACSSRQSVKSSVLRAEQCPKEAQKEEPLEPCRLLLDTSKICKKEPQKMKRQTNPLQTQKPTQLSQNPTSKKTTKPQPPRPQSPTFSNSHHYP